MRRLGYSRLVIGVAVCAVLIGAVVFMGQKSQSRHPATSGRKQNSRSDYRVNC